MSNRQDVSNLCGYGYGAVLHKCGALFEISFSFRVYVLYTLSFVLSGWPLFLVSMAITSWVWWPGLCAPPGSDASVFCKDINSIYVMDIKLTTPVTREGTRYCNRWLISKCLINASVLLDVCCPERSDAVFPSLEARYDLPAGNGVSCFIKERGLSETTPDIAYDACCYAA